MDLSNFSAQVLQAIAQFGGISWIGKVALIVSLVVASMKVSALSGFWNKLGPAKAWLSPVLGLIGGVLALSLHGESLSAAKIFAYASAGAGAVLLVELLELIKAIPGVGGLWVMIISVIESALKPSKK